MTDICYEPRVFGHGERYCPHTSVPPGALPGPEYHWAREPLDTNPYPGDPVAEIFSGGRSWWQRRSQERASA